MGISVVHGIVTRCGGHIDVDSRVGEGKTFTVLLPALPEAPEEATSGDPILPLGTERILLIDDEPFQVDMGRQMLERLGYRVHTETDSLQALESLRRAPEAFDPVITDMNMRPMNGDLFACELLAIRPDLPIILCTGYSEDISDERAATIGLRGLAMKPVVMKDMAAMVRKVLDLREPLSRDAPGS